LKVTEEYDYRNAKGILQPVDRENLDELTSALDDPGFRLRIGAPAGKQQDLSRQVQEAFHKKGWVLEKPLFSLPDLRYDLYKGQIPVEIEIGHERLVYAVFFKFLADYSARKIPAGVMVVTSNPKDFGHTWHNSVVSTRRKMESIQNYLLVPILVLGISP
jgi:hypothetical protein